jgi:guanosine-3',5'-bis(diphosphate) 3'-pyrophosphohydrolase
LVQALRAEGIDNVTHDDPTYDGVWEKLLRFTGNKTRQELLTDIGLGKRIANIVAKRLVHLLMEKGTRPDALLLTRERFTNHDSSTLRAITLDGSENASVQFATCCRPIPGDAILGYLGRGEGLVVHRDECQVAKKLQYKDSERFIGVEWSDEPVRPFETEVVVTVTNGKGVLAKVAASLASAEADIVHIDMGQEGQHDATDLRFIIAIRDHNHLESVLRALARTSFVLRASRKSAASTF